MIRNILTITLFLILLILNAESYGASPVPTATSTFTPTFTSTITPSPTRTHTPSCTHTPTFTPTYTITLSVTQTFTVTRSITPTLTVTITPFKVRRSEVITYPSPAKGNTAWFYYQIQAPARVTIDIYNLSGEKGKTLTNTNNVGTYGTTSWTISDVASGVYFYTVTIEEGLNKRVIGPKKMIIIKQ